MFKIKNLQVSIDNKKILKDFNIDINPGELHVIMGPNGSGKSTLTNAIAGKDNYLIDNGEILYNNKLINDLDPEERAGEGIFVSFQYPTSLPGVNNIYFLREAVNSIRKYRNQDEINSVDFFTHWGHPRIIYERRRGLGTCGFRCPLFLSSCGP